MKLINKGIKSGIQAHAETYSFNIESELFNQLTKEQQALWRKEIEQACISGGEVGVELAKDPRYNENFEVKEANNIWNDARRTVPEGSTEQIICVKEDGLAIVTVGKIANGTVKWAYLNNLLKLSSNNEVKEVDFEQELDSIWFANKFGEYFNNDAVDFARIRTICKHFFELGLKTQKVE